MTDEPPDAGEPPNEKIPSRWWLRLGHDLRSPIAPMRMALQLLRGGPERSAEQREALIVLERQIDQLLVEIEDLSDLARINAGTFATKLAPTDLNLVIDMIAGRAALGRRLDERSQTLRCIAAGSPVTVDHDPQKIVDLLEFLIAKAAKHAQVGSTMTLALEPPSQTKRARFIVSGSDRSLEDDPGFAYVAGRSSLSLFDLEARPIVMREVAGMHRLEFELRSERFEVIFPVDEL
jgi:K+-sensing histidine kinase KdpD